MSHWSTPIFRNTLDRFDELDRVLNLSTTGIRQILHIPAALTAIHEYDREYGDNYDADDGERRLENARTLASFAEREVTRDFPIIHGQAAVSLWGHLEALVEDLVVVFLRNDPQLLTRAEFSRIRLPLAEYQRLDDEDRLRFLVQDLARSTNADLKQGIGRFEVLLSAVTLDGPVSSDTSKTLFELSHARNVIVHRASRVDRKFLAACPWVGIPFGSYLSINSARYSDYRTAVADYVMELLVRGLVYRGTSRSEAEQRIRKPVSDLETARPTSANPE